MDIAIVIAVVSTAIAFIALAISWQGVRTAKRAVRQASLQRLFGAFDLASRASLEDPGLLYDVHSLDKSVPREEARKIAYLSLLMDGFQHFYGEAYSGDFGKMGETLKKKSTFLNCILAIRANQERWKTLKKLYYDDFDSSFIQAVDDLIEYENKERGKPV